jgi:hypothetical protein
LVIDSRQLIILVILMLGIGLSVDFAATGVAGQLNVWGLPGAMLPIALVLLSGHVIALVARQHDLILAVPIAILTIGPFVQTYDFLLAIAANRGWLNTSQGALELIYVWSGIAWWGIASGTAVLRLTQASATRRLLAVACFAALIVLPVANFPPRSVGALWIDRQDQPSEDVGSDVITEDALYAQGNLLRERLAALEPGRGDAPSLFFVGVAGDAREDVFRHEVVVIRELLRQRFGAATHDVVLINSEQTVLEEPAATATSLELTLKRVGALMREQDVLLLYLTSHGSEDHHFALELPPLRIADLDPEGLKRMLEAAGIRWRVIVVSACYSGGFIAPLSDERSLVITAADADHTSFGCGSESDFTYFGKAYFDEALRRTYSFTEAFQLARRAIEVREKAEGLTPSNPQMRAGELIHAKLRRLQADWEATDRTPAVTHKR